MRIYLTSVFLFGWLVGQTMAQIPNEQQVLAATKSITDDSLRAHIQFLADDLLEGRGPGTRGDELAMAYIAAQFQLLGLQPLGQDGGWIQPVPLVGVITQPPKELEFRTNNGLLKLKNYEQYIVNSGQPEESLGFENAELVFVGYGMQAPEYEWDNFKDVDVKGKVLLVMNNDVGIPHEKLTVNQC